MQQILYSLFSVFLGGAGTYFITSVFSMMKADIDTINDHINEIRHIEDLATEYWLRNWDEVREGELEARLKGAFTASAQFNRVARRILGCRYNQYSSLDTQFYDLATGGEFEHAGRAADPDTVVEIIATGTEMRAVLREARRSIYWAR